MRFVLTNDDGIGAPGLLALERAVDGDAVTVAPKEAHSGCSHQATFWDRPIHVDKKDERHFGVDGTPADCTRIALFDLCPEPDFVLSGINKGGNLGVDTWLSGTVAAAREAAFMGIPAIAFSQYYRPDVPIDWDRTARWTRGLLDDITSRPHEHGTFWNVNFPFVEEGGADPEIVECPVCTQPLPVVYEIDGENYHYRGKYGERLKDSGADVDQCFSGKITVSRLLSFNQ